MGTEYEFVFLTPTEVDEKKLKDTFTELEKQIKSIKGKIIDKEDWGRQQLAYEIKGNKRAFFRIWQLSLPQDFNSSSLNTFLNRSDIIIRYLLLKSFKKKGEK